ncbi:MAG: hypothetical protein AAFN50_03095 [Pseudomonadota bacterium]
MAELEFGPAKPPGSASRATLLLLGCLLATPVFAATPHHILCSESDSPTLDVPIESLTTEVISHDLSVKSIEKDDTIVKTKIVLNTPVLEPRARQAIRNAFRDELIETAADDIKVEVETDDAEIDEQPPRVMNTQLPGVTQEKLERYKRQMYRRDI